MAWCPTHYPKLGSRLATCAALRPPGSCPRLLVACPHERNYACETERHAAWPAQAGLDRFYLVFATALYVDTVFAATLSGQATLNSFLINVQQIADGYAALEKSWVDCDRPRDGEKLDLAMQIARVMACQVISLTAKGSPALGLASVAVGRLHAYWALELKFGTWPRWP
jgi:hypothetical protein